MFKKLVHLSYLLIYILKPSEEKYVEGELNTSENWAFIARFCFLSDDGQFEYYIEFNEEQGEPNLLLYYDEDDQWPAIYKSNKTCYGKESVLKRERNQILNLTARYPVREIAGCVTTIQGRTTPTPKYTVNMPTLATTKRRTTTTPKMTLFSTKPTTTTTTTDSYTITETARSTTDDYYTSFSPTTESEFSSTISGSVGVTRKIEKLVTEVVKTSDTTIGDLQIFSTIDPLVKNASKKLIKRHVSAQQVHYQPKGHRTVVCRNARRFRSSRERWWFIAVSNCNGAKGIHIKYKFLMTNGPPGDYWHEHFSADEFYVLPVLMAFSIAYSMLMLAIVIYSIELKSRQLLHSTYKLFAMSVLVQFFGIIIKSLAFLKYAVNGAGSPKLKTMGGVLMGTSETCFILLLLLLAKGYTVTRGRLPLSGGIKLTIFMCLYVVTYLSLFIYEAKVFDPGEVLYTYESPAGYGLIVLRIMAWCMFIYSTVFTLKHYPEKANFYYPFNVFGTLWFIAGPAFIISANTYIDKWVRESIVCAVLLFITFGGHLMFLLLTMPSVANKNFPYHVRTTQIGVMELTGTAGNSCIEQFGHHVYEPTENAEQTVIIPLSRRTEEIFGGLYSQHIHTTLGRSRRNGEGEAEVQNGPNPNDMIMENVLSWSIAKNFTTMDLAHFDKVMRSNRGSTRSSTFAEEASYNLPALTDGHPSAPPEIPPNFNQQPSDWVKDVPVELFTVSKMVVTRHNASTRQTHDSD